MEDTKSWYYNEAKRLGYNGPLRWKGSTKQQWKEIYEGLRPQPVFRDERAHIQQPQEVPLYAERIDPNDINIRRIRFPMEEVLGDILLTQNNVDAFKEAIQMYFDEVFQQVNHLRPKYQIAVVGNNRVFATHFTDDIQQMIFEINEECDRFAQEYDTGFGDNLNIEFLEINYILNHEEPIRGMCKTINDANDKWFILDTNTRKNCVFIAIYTGLNWRADTRLLSDSSLRINNAKMWKSRLGMIDDAPTLSDIKLIAQKWHCTVRVYNNIFELIAVFEYGACIVEIQVANCHARAMILREELTQFAPQFNIEYNLQNQIRESGKDVFAGIKKIFPKKTPAAHDRKIVAWDLETYTVKKQNIVQQLGADKEFAVYCSGLAYYSNNTTVFKQFYTDQENLKLFLGYIKENIDTFSGYTFYAHNGGKFDLILLLRDVLTVDPEIEIVGKKMIELNNSFIGLSIKYQGHYIHFKDSYRLFQSSLHDITRDMKVETLKGELDHNKITATTYLQHSEEVKKYHRADCIGLLECLTKMSEQVYNEFRLNITDCFTAASLSKKIYMSKFLKSKHGVYRLDNTTDEFIRRSYQGGRNECFHLGELFDLYYYDFTSLYPRTGTLLMPVSTPKNISTEGKTIVQLLNEISLGFIECNVTGSKEMLGGMKPLHGVLHNNRLVFPYLKTPTRMVLFSQEIKEGLNIGYKYEPIKCVAFEREYILKEFFEHGFKKKAESKKNGEPALSYMWKIIINSGYGFWGFNPYNKDTVKIYNRGRGWLEYLAKNRLKAINKVGEYTLARVSNDTHSADTNVAIASAITSYARIMLWRAINDIESKGGRVYYCDTDSIITDLKLSEYPDLMKKYRPDGTGECLGGLKNELGLKDSNDLCFSNGTFVGCKMYTVVGMNAKNQYIEMNKLKGFKDSTNEDINKMNEGVVIGQVQTQFLCNKNDYLREVETFNIRIHYSKKKFKKLYTKGTILGSGEIIPLEI